MYLHQRGITLPNLNYDNILVVKEKSMFKAKISSIEAAIHGSHRRKEIDMHKVGLIFYHILAGELPKDQIHFNIYILNENCLNVEEARHLLTLLVHPSPSRR
ncbi:unnamed protein product [Cuscuta epithymum]|uniref:Protein kinase domain-containing protein n=1 Tax=Cuscuta epithymum TaxID=186058 RepID=A0AAV0E128_9ASTE|nr:unnamed protein product [Cuscuta epithymum]CAH9114133.1 unnamed protein product [Cuscuta epithymum]CAH9147034.1 unnamed protein product [Cuscuta epithymum]CAH9147043.1 unnamed protein product [Cuscuta epithymum]